MRQRNIERKSGKLEKGKGERKKENESGVSEKKEKKEKKKKKGKVENSYTYLADHALCTTTPLILPTICGETFVRNSCSKSLSSRSWQFPSSDQDR
jgi:hypothetical protein